jgi:hypothetical protein
MAAYRGRTPFRRGLTLAVAIASVGYVSGVVTRRQCETAVAHRIGEELETRDVFALPSGTPSPAEEYAGTEAILKRAGFSVRRCVPVHGPFNCFPWAGVSRANVVGPFLVDVRWGFVAGPLSGHGGRTRYFTFLGWALSIREFGEWAA